MTIEKRFATRVPFFLSLCFPLVLTSTVAAQAETALESRRWSFAAEADLYLQEDVTFVMPTLSADRGLLHFESRWNYEDLETLSVWVGATLEAGRTVELSVTPMVGALLGRTKGFAPGLEISLAWKRLSFSSASELVFDVQGPEGDFFYNWSELTVQTMPWLSVGIATQRTRLYESEREVDLGPFVSFERGAVSLSLYGLNVDGDAPFLIVALAVEF